jgi:ABC-type transporter Mla subunit MlaD
VLARFAPFAIAAAIIAVVVIIFTSGGTTHELKAGFDNAIQLTGGQEVRIAGRKVGKIGDIELKDGHALVTLKITDDDVWPLSHGTIARARYGSTTSYLSRYVELYPGPNGTGSLADGAILPTNDNQSAYELDSSYRIFRGNTDKQTGQLVDGLGKGIDDQGPALSQGLAAAPSGLDAAASLTSELAFDGERLRTLADAGDQTTTALAAKSGDLRNLVTNAAGAFSEFAQHTRAQQIALDKAPETFKVTTSTLARFDTSIDGLQGLVNDLRPGAPALRRFAETARGTLHQLRDTAPLIASTLDRGTTAAPRLQRLFNAGTPFFSQARAALNGFNPQFSCIRAYTPELVGFLTDWTGALKNYDVSGHYARSFPLTVIPNLLPGNATTPAQAINNQPGITYAFPRPPGLAVGKPWFMPRCGVTKDALNPELDPEAARK